MTFDIIILIIGLGTLILGGDVLVKSASRIALRFQVSTLTVGLTIVAFSTSAPELLVSVKAALKGVPDFALGNIVGSNIANLTLVLGITALISRIPIGKMIAKRDWPITFASSIILFLFAWNGIIDHYEGYILFGLLICYLVFLLRYTKKDEVELDIEKPKEDETQFDKIKDIILMVFGGVCLYFGSEWFVIGGESLASNLGVSERVIGLTILALGTSLPELITSIIAARKKETNLALGNLLGSNIFNILSILGITSIIKDLNVNPTIIKTDMVWMLVITFGILPLMIFRKRLGTVAGVILLTSYSVYVFLVFR